MATVELKKNGANIPVTRANRSVFFFLPCDLVTSLRNTLGPYPSLYTLRKIEHQHCAVDLGPIGCILSVLAVHAACMPDANSLCKQWVRSGSLLLASACTEMPGLIRETPDKCIKYP